MLNKLDDKIFTLGSTPFVCLDACLAHNSVPSFLVLFADGKKCREATWLVM